MGFIMRLCTKPAEHHHSPKGPCFHGQFGRMMTCCVLVLSGLAGCAAKPDDYGFDIEQVAVRSAQHNISITLTQRMRLSREARNALTHGVPLRIHTQIVLHRTGSWFNLSHVEQQFEIRYLPLSGLYRLSTHGDSSAQTFPRLRHALSALSQVTLQLPTTEVAADQLEICARSYLDKRQLPAPMRLPTLFSARWKHDSGWVGQALITDLSS